MALQPVNIATLRAQDQVVDAQGRPNNFFLRYLNGVLRQLANGINGIVAAQNAADAANAAAAWANAAAVSAANTADAITREQALVNSYIMPSSVLTASPTTITIAGHTRYYGDGTSVAVSGGSIPATGVTDVDYVYYNDPPRTGGAVTYIVSTTQPTQVGDTHVVGAVTIPGAGTQPGGQGPQRPGHVNLIP